MPSEREELLEQLFGRGLLGHDAQRAADFILSDRARTAKAYGGCTDCYGKGYATHDEYASGGGMKWHVGGPVKYCTCERGKQLKDHIARIRADLAWCVGKLRGLEHPATEIEKRYGLAQLNQPPQGEEK